MHQLFEKYFTIVKQFLPENVPTAVGIDLGTSACKFVELKRKNARYELIGWGIEPDQADPKVTLRQALSKIQTSSSYPVAGLQGKGTMIRYVDMPRMSAADLEKSFAFEADKFLPFPKDQIYADNFILDPKGKEPRMKVLVAAAKKELLNERLKLFQDLQQQVDVVTLNALAIANVVNVLGLPRHDSTEDQKTGDPVALLDIGHLVSSLTIMIDSQPWFNRDILVGGKDFTKSLSNSLNVSSDEAEQLKLRPGARKAEVLEKMDSVIAHFVSELRLSFDYFITEKNRTISRLLLTGGSAHLEGLQALIARHLEMDVAQWDPFSLLDATPEIMNEQFHKEKERLTVALGLALSQSM